MKKIPTLDVTRFHTSIYSDTLDFAFKKILQKVIPHYSSPLSLFAEEEVTNEIDEGNNNYSTNTKGEDILVTEVDVQAQQNKNINKDVLKAELTRQFENAFVKIELRMKLRKQLDNFSNEDESLLDDAEGDKPNEVSNKVQK
jgi:hypothetical protein